MHIEKTYSLWNRLVLNANGIVCFMDGWNGNYDQKHLAQPPCKGCKKRDQKNGVSEGDEDEQEEKSYRDPDNDFSISCI